MPVSDHVLNPKLLETINRFGQQHVLQYRDRLDEMQRRELISQLEQIDFELMNELIQKALRKDNQSLPPQNMEPDKIIALSQRSETDSEVKALGEEALARGKVAAFIVAGGQGTRLGFDGPKGMYPIGPVTQRSLFEIHAHKIRAVAEKYGTQIPWYIMTSKTNDQQTRSFFEKMNFFGFQPEQVKFFSQEMIPAIDHNGKFILDAPHHIFVNPNGHGGSLQALYKSGAVDEMMQNGIRYIFYFQVDNVLTRICDPVYLGYHIRANSEMSNKVVRKKSAEEKMGVICKLNGRTGLMEYSDISDEDMRATSADGELKYWAGSIATHYINTEFVSQLNKSRQILPYHIAHKKVPFIDAQGQRVIPNDPNGYKFEMFVFDALQFAQKTVSIEADRSLEYSGLKNKSGDNSPQTVRRDLIRSYQRWLSQQGFQIPQDNSVKIEIDPLFAARVESGKAAIEFPAEAHEIILK